MEMYTPPVEDNLAERIKCHLYRGRSLRQMEMLTEALMDLVEATKLDPSNKELEAEANGIRNQIESNGGDGWKEEWETDLL